MKNQTAVKDHSVGSNEMIDHIGDSNGMVSDSKGGELDTFTEKQIMEAVKMAQTRKYNSHFYNADEII